MLFIIFLFFKQKTAYEMRISDWSSDVCSSDLTGAELVFERRDQAQRNEQQRSLTDEVDPIAGGIDSRRESDRTYRRQAKQECCKHGLPFAQCMPGSDDGCCHHACNRECGPRRQRIGARRARRRPIKVDRKSTL